MRADFGMPLALGALEDDAHVLVIGNFDGVHLGHQALLAAARRHADRAQGLVLAATFIPHPRIVLGGADPIPLLSPPEMRRRLLGALGVDRLLVLPFDEHLRSLEPDDFLNRLRSRYRLTAIVAGPRFSIGRGGSGRLSFLQSYCEQEGLALEVVAPVMVGGREVSSSAIRQLLQEGRLEEAKVLLGHPFTILGEVEHGEERGRRLGFATANLRWAEGQALPPDGVYVMRARAAGIELLPAVGSIGTRPQYGPGPRTLEVHCLQDPGSLYGQTLEVQILSRLRDQAVFGTEAELVAQISRDVQAAREYLLSLPG